MIIYCLKIEVPWNVGDAYESWLKEHAQKVLKHSDFSSCEILTPGPSENKIHKFFWVHYHAESEQIYEDYLASGAATAMRQEGLERFGDSAKIERHILHLKHHYEKK